MRRFLRATVPLLAALLAVASAVHSQELPGTPSGELPAPLRDLYEQRGLRPAPVPAPPPGAPPGSVMVPLRIERPWLTLVPDIRVATGYSDNVFITPDVLGFEEESDGLLTFAPRLRALFRLSRELGLVADYGLGYTQFLSNGHSLQNSGTIFLGYRPTSEKHAEFGVRGGTARVSEFSDSDVNEGHLFASGNYPLNEMASASIVGSVGLREFPDRTRIEAESLVLGIPPLVIPIPGEITTEKGENDVVTNVGGALAMAYSTSGAVRAGYDFTNNDSDFSEVDYLVHRVSVAGVNAWWPWLSTQVAYSLSSRRFKHSLADDEQRERRDAIHDLTLTAYFTPPMPPLPYTRSWHIRVDYDLLASRSNSQGGKFDRNFFSVSLEIGLAPITNLHFRQWIWGTPPTVERAPLGTP